MIIYRELASLENDLGYSAKMMYSLSNTINTHYHEADIPKGNGEYRKLFIPDIELKTLQKKIANVILNQIEISPYAAAYRIGGSTLRNAKPHVGHAVLLKLDIRHFFDKITYALIRELVFSNEVFSESNGILLSTLCCYKDCLPQGAPTSPAISNIIMRGFDNAVGTWCGEGGIEYTRYCDDMTFSGSFDTNQLTDFVSAELKKLGFYLNSKKTRIVKQGQRQTVTGIVVNERISIPAYYKRKIRQEIYYCRKYGVASHILKVCPHQSSAEYLSGLLGRINYVLSAEPNNDDMKEYKTAVIEWKNRL